ncbi:MAG TPA: hypothetical protein DCF45_01560, partial [Gammaproteobacteria bacterium]|nr:hypothetical protein [Gammaproteobacteria bacterium]
MCGSAAGGPGSYIGHRCTKIGNIEFSCQLIRYRCVQEFNDYLTRFLATVYADTLVAEINSDSALTSAAAVKIDSRYLVTCGAASGGGGEGVCNRANSDEQVVSISLCCPASCLIEVNNDAGTF